MRIGDTNVAHRQPGTLGNCLTHLRSRFRAQSTDVEVYDQRSRLAVAQRLRGRPLRQIHPRRSFMRLRAPVGMGNAHRRCDIGAANSRQQLFYWILCHTLLLIAHLSPHLTRIGKGLWRGFHITQNAGQGLTRCGFKGVG